MSQHLRRSVLAGLCAAAALALTACSSAAGTSTAPDGSATASGASATAASATPAALLSGSKLDALLLPADAIPTQLKADPSGSQNTGDGFNPPVSPSSLSTSKACNLLTGTSWINTSGLSSASFAQNDYTSSSGEMFAQEIDAFRGTAAETVMSHLKKVFKECASFTMDVDGNPYAAKVTTKELSGVGDQALQAVVTSPSLRGGTTLVAVRTGSSVITTLYNDTDSGTGSAGVALTKSLAAKVATADS